MKNQINEKQSRISRKTIKKYFIIIGTVLIISFTALVLSRAVGFKNITSAADITEEEKYTLSAILQNEYADRYSILHSLPFTMAVPDLDIYAESAILIDTSNGNILYEKNADDIIPPASMTKLFSMYVVDEAVSEGKIKYDDIIPLPEESWACNMPPHSSLMFLGKGQKVTLDELLLGLSICSGNDAAYALAYTICGSMEAFVDRMNEVAKEIGLTNTHFVESSGYSELNTTTAREMASFARIYLMKHPDSLLKYHAVPDFTYPKERNLALGDKLAAQDFSQGLPEHITMPITQKNTNPLLGKLDGCDGLKTGYIDESGYNLALTARRDNTRYLSVTMRGPGSNTREGQAGRIHDGTNLMEWAFSSFKDFKKTEAITSYVVKVFGGKNTAMNLIPAYSLHSSTIPYITGNSIEDNMEKVQVVTEIPRKLRGQIIQGQEYGRIKIVLDNKVIDYVPMVADRTINQANIFIRLADNLILSVYKLVR